MSAAAWLGHDIGIADAVGLDVDAQGPEELLDQGHLLVLPPEQRRSDTVDVLWGEGLGNGLATASRG
eukprot:5486579-Alexandrium_andersonii.AAC.1